MRQLVYISGPPCSGKSTVAKEVLEAVGGFALIKGDDFWKMNEALPFEEHVRVTNQMILESVQKMNNSKLLLEWVPSFPPFLNDLTALCKSENRYFSHIVLVADSSELAKRKLERDGDREVGQPNIEKLLSIEDVLVVDTSRCSLQEEAQQCIDFVLKRLGNFP